MSNKEINLTPAEWSIMECLWDISPKTGRELTELLQRSTGWNRSTTLTLLRRLEAKGAVASDTKNGLKSYRPIINREDAALQEAENLLSRVYKGSLSLMLSSLTKKQSLSKREIDELYAILQEIEATRDD